MLSEFVGEIFFCYFGKQKFDKEERKTYNELEGFFGNFPTAIDLEDIPIFTC